MEDPSSLEEYVYDLTNKLYNTGLEMIKNIEKQWKESSMDSALFEILGGRIKATAYITGKDCITRKHCLQTKKREK